MLTLGIVVGLIALAFVLLWALVGGAKLGGPEDTRVGGRDLTRQEHRAMLARIEAEQRRLQEKSLTRK